jgi:hypothetical protein
MTGERGQLLTEYGHAYIKLDQPRHDARRPFGSEWVKEENYAPIMRASFAQIAFYADRELKRATGRQIAKKEWHELSQDEKRLWMEGCPSLNPASKLLYEKIKEALAGLMQ